jgi:superkiller protein 3
LVPAFFVLDRYCQERPNDESALHLFGLVCERVGHYDLAEELITKAISILEAKYEESEDPAIEKQFTIANTNLGRLRAANGDFEGALESLETALGLIGDDDSVESYVLRTQSYFVTGLSRFKCGDLNGAMESFQLALGTAGEDLAMGGHVSVLLAQALWSLGGDEAQESAKSQLLQWYVDKPSLPSTALKLKPYSSINSDPENLEAINLLAGMGILTDDDGLVDAALSEMLSLPLHQRAAMDPHHDVNGLLVKHHLGQVSSMHPRFRLSLTTDLLFLGRHPKSVLGSPEGDLCTTHVEGAENTSRIAGSTKRSQRSGPRSAGFRQR